MRKLATWILALAEWFFLKAHGWHRIKLRRGAHPRYNWASPSGYPRPHEAISRSHAVNSQRFYLGRAAAEAFVAKLGPKS